MFQKLYQILTCLYCKKSSSLSDLEARQKEKMKLLKEKSSEELEKMITQEKETEFIRFLKRKSDQQFL